MSGIIALLQGATILYFGNSANAMSIRANDLPVYFTNDTTGNGANSSSSSDIPCLSEFASCGTDEVCMQCMLAIIAEGDDEDSDGDVSVTDEESDGDVSVTDDSDEDGEDDDDDLSEISCDTLSSMTCDMYGTNTTCLNNDVYEAYIGEHGPGEMGWKQLDTSVGWLPCNMVILHILHSVNVESYYINQLHTKGQWATVESSSRKKRRLGCTSNAIIVCYLLPCCYPCFLGGLLCRYLVFLELLPDASKICLGRLYC